MQSIIDKMQKSVGNGWLDSTSLYIHAYGDRVHFTLSRGMKREAYRGDDLGELMSAVNNLKPRNEILYRKFSI